MLVDSLKIFLLRYRKVKIRMTFSLLKDVSLHKQLKPQIQHLMETIQDRCNDSREVNDIFAKDQYIDSPKLFHFLTHRTFDDKGKILDEARRSSGTNDLLQRALVKYMDTNGSSRNTDITRIMAKSAEEIAPHVAYLYRPALASKRSLHDLLLFREDDDDTRSLTKTLLHFGKVCSFDNEIREGMKRCLRQLMHAKKCVSDKGRNARSSVIECVEIVRAAFLQHPTLSPVMKSVHEIYRLYEERTMGYILDKSFDEMRDMDAYVTHQLQKVRNILDKIEMMLRTCGEEECTSMLMQLL